MQNLPLNALRALAAIYETGGIRAAARILHVNASAVHRHLRDLEARLGTSLVSAGRPLEFTAHGERLARQAQETLASLSGAYEAVREDRSANSVIISTTNSFAAKWLVPRLAKLRELKPLLRVTIVTERRFADVPREATLAIRLGAGPWPNEFCEPFMDEEIFPVASAEFLETHPVREPADILRYPLIDDRDPQADWSRWHAAFGVEKETTTPELRLTSSDLVLQAAASGLGIAMARSKLAEFDIASGAMCDDLRRYSVPIGTAYWLVRPASLRAAEAEFVTWLFEQR
jgi:LysR family transcriptional regulator, glycine cleavage system transcriptional activator